MKLERNTAMTSTERCIRIAELNDELRRFVPVFPNDTKNKIVLTSGICELGDSIVEILQKVREFNLFDKDNDFYGEHGSGAFDHKGNKIFWKIDYYDNDMKHGSEDPADPSQTIRVLTIMLASEY